MNEQDARLWLRFVSQTGLSFSENLENHIDAIWYFIHDYNFRIATV
ncbi:hypothetical protein H6F44_11735 [Pseudanabaena sp. FACHB-1277]|jgi:hypothetical protein|uniref:Uncharacterized protein n=1 Tax=Pseudanabaena cinerea FACHB-1277 TaxID=2949581 RepID=A0A926Z5Z1_9CYAN|nr:hypothetical protein [Pseudanabaena cinerea FACHB-1277]